MASTRSPASCPSTCKEVRDPRLGADRQDRGGGQGPPHQGDQLLGPPRRALKPRAGRQAQRPPQLGKKRASAPTTCRPGSRSAWKNSTRSDRSPPCRRWSWAALVVVPIGLHRTSCKGATQPDRPSRRHAGRRRARPRHRHGGRARASASSPSTASSRSSATTSKAAYPARGQLRFIEVKGRVSGAPTDHRHQERDPLLAQQARRLHPRHRRVPRRRRPPSALPAAPLPRQRRHHRLRRRQRQLPLRRPHRTSRSTLMSQDQGNARPKEEAHRSRPAARRHQQGLGAGEVDPARASQHAAPVVGAAAAGGGAGGDLRADGGRPVGAPGPVPDREGAGEGAASGCSRSSRTWCCGRTPPTRRCCRRRATRSGQSWRRDLRRECRPPAGQGAVRPQQAARLPRPLRRRRRAAAGGAAAGARELRQRPEPGGGADQQGDDRDPAEVRRASRR